MANAGHIGVNIVNPIALSPVGPSRLFTGYGVAGPSGVVTGAEGPSRIVNGHGTLGPIGPNGPGIATASPVVAATPAFGVAAIGHGIGYGFH